jgi:hypothetical protein
MSEDKQTTWSLWESVDIDISLSDEDETVLFPIEERLSAAPYWKHRRSLLYFLKRWKAFVTFQEQWAHHFEEYADEVTVRDIIEEDFLQNLPAALRLKIPHALEPLDAKYTSNTREVDKPWFGNGRPMKWWWHRCPESWAYYREHRADSSNDPNFVT